MARVKTIQSIDDVPVEHQAAYEIVAGTRKGEVRGAFTVLMYSPEVATRSGPLGAYLRYDSAVDLVTKELVMITIGREEWSQATWSFHVNSGLEAGVRPEAIEAIRHGTTDGLTSEEADVVGYVQQLCRRKRVADKTFDAMLSRFGIQGLVDITALAGYFVMQSMANNAFRVDPRFPDLLDFDEDAAGQT